MNQTLTFLTQIAHGLAAQFGSSCEIVIHDLAKRDLENSIVYIENGHVTNRQLGDGPSSIVLETLNKKPEQIKDRLSYLTKTDDGRFLKSSTMYIREHDHTIRYILSLNYDITTLLAAQSALQSLSGTEPESGIQKQPPKITHNVNDLLDTLIEQAIALVGKPAALMSKNEKVAVVQYLNDAGAFLITKSGDKIATLLGVSKFTLYSYMDTSK